MANTQRGNPIFAVRLPAEMQAAIREAAKQNGLGVAEWVASAVRMALDNPQAAPGSAAGTVDRKTYQSDLDALTARIEALEAAIVKRSKAGGKPKAEAATMPATPVKTFSTVRKKGNPLSADEIAQLRTWHGEGIKAPAIAQRLGLHRATVYSYIGKLGLEG